MKIVTLADTHGYHYKVDVPNGDMVIHAGDMTMDGTFNQLATFFDWFKELPHKYKVVIPGNHDFWLAEKEIHCIPWENIIYLHNSMVTIEGIRIYGFPYIPPVGKWAFMMPHGQRQIAVEKIPEVDILVTHTPPRGILDITEQDRNVGCLYLREYMFRSKAKYNVFGHIHESTGIEELKDTFFVNCSICDENYRPVNKPKIIFYENGKDESLDEKTYLSCSGGKER